MNSKNNNQNTKLNEKFKRNRASRNPVVLIEKIIKNLIQKNAFKSKRFWFTNILVIFAIVKMIQFSKYMSEFSYFIPKEELERNNMKFNKKGLSQMEKEELFKKS